MNPQTSPIEHANTKSFTTNFAREPAIEIASLAPWLRTQKCERRLIHTAPHGIKLPKLIISGTVAPRLAAAHFQIAPRKSQRLASETAASQSRETFPHEPEASS